MLKIFWLDPAYTERIEAAYRELFAYMDERLADLRPEGDTSFLAREQQEGNVRPEEVRDWVIFALEGSTDNTVHQIALPPREPCRIPAIIATLEKANAIWSRSTMNILIHVLPGLAVLACAAVYGADLFAAIVLRGALSKVDDQTLTTTMGRVHEYGDRRMPIPFAISVLTSVLSVIVALIAERPGVAVASGVAVVALLCWITIYLRVSAPVNRALIGAVVEGTPLPDARALQRRWDSVVPIRLTLQATAVAALCTALAIA